MSRVLTAANERERRNSALSTANERRSSSASKRSVLIYVSPRSGREFHSKIIIVRRSAGAENRAGTVLICRSTSHLHLISKTSFPPDIPNAIFARNRLHSSNGGIVDASRGISCECAQSQEEKAVSAGSGSLDLGLLIGPWVAFRYSLSRLPDTEAQYFLPRRAGSEK